MNETNETNQIQDVTRDAKVISKREELLNVLKAYVKEAEKFDSTGEWQAEIEMTHIMQYDIPRARKSVIKAMW